MASFKIERIMIRHNLILFLAMWRERIIIFMNLPLQQPMMEEVVAEVAPSLLTLLKASSYLILRLLLLQPSVIIRGLAPIMCSMPMAQKWCVIM